MEFFSSLFFILAPFALIFAKNGAGFVVCPLLLVLGFVFRWLDKHYGCNSKSKIKVKPKEVWEFQYKIFLNTRGGDRDARKWATSICEMNECPVPSEEERERIAKENGVITKKMKKEIIDCIDRVQFGKAYLIKKSIKEYEAKRDVCQIWEKRREIDKIIQLLKTHVGQIGFVLCGSVIYAPRTHLKKKFGTSEEAEIWHSVLSESEREEAENWARECVERFIRELSEMDSGMVVNRDYEYKKQHGFIVFRSDLI